MTIYTVPISVKGIVFENNKVWLRQNERKEWELPGGKLDQGEQPEQTVVRELHEELGFQTEVIDIVQAHLYIILVNADESRGVLVVSYLCKLLAKTGAFETIGETEAAKFQTFSIPEIATLNMPAFYKNAIVKAQRLFT